MSPDGAGPVEDAELLARYVLTQSWLYKDQRPGSPLRPNAWLPLPHIELSVYRIDGWSEETIGDQGRKVAEEREAGHREKCLGEGKAYPETKTTFRYYGRGQILAKEVRTIGLEVVSAPKPHPRHADITNWPPLSGNRKHDEAGQMVLAMKLQAKAEFVGLP